MQQLEAELHALKASCEEQARQSRQQKDTLTEELRALQRLQDQQAVLSSQRGARHTQLQQRVRALERQQEDANGRGLLQFEAEQLRNDEKLLSSKELAFDDPPRISPGSFTTPPGFSGGRDGQLMRPSASRTHSPPSSRTPAFPHEQAKLQDNDPRPSPGSTY